MIRNFITIEIQLHFLDISPVSPPPPRIRSSTNPTSCFATTKYSRIARLSLSPGDTLIASTLSDRREFVALLPE